MKLKTMNNLIKETIERINKVRFGAMDENQFNTMIEYNINNLLEKQREEIQFKLNKHWDKLETNNYDFKDMETWRIFKCIRNNNNDVINDKTS